MVTTLIIIILIVFGYILFKNKVESDNTERRIRVKKLSEEIYKKESFTAKSIISKIELVKVKDDFEEIETTYFNNISQDGYKYLPMYYEKIGGDFVSHIHIGIGFSIFQENIYLDVTSYGENQMGLAKGDRLILLFENDEKIDIVFSQARVSNSVVKSNSYVLSEEELKIFASSNLNKWKLISTFRNIYVVGDNSYFSERDKVQNKKTFQEVLKYLAITITNQINLKQWELK